MHAQKDIGGAEDIKQLVDAFYNNLRKDALLAPVFNGVIGDGWPEHLEKMYAFWQTVLFGEPAYKGNPFPPHQHLPLRRAHFDAWLNLWQDAVDAQFVGEKANDAKRRARKMAIIFMSKMGCLSA